jgi:hypothetical protein
LLFCQTQYAKQFSEIITGNPASIRAFRRFKSRVNK